MIHFLLKLLSLLLFSKADYEEFPYDYSNSELLGYKEGVVGNESFIYYYIHHSGNIVISLNSSTGDADLYISETKLFPTYYPDTYDLHSATCGIDIVEVPLSFKSPISVGIYGHSAHESSKYILQIFKHPEADRAFAIIEDELIQDTTQKVVNGDLKTKNNKIKGKKNIQQVAKKVDGMHYLFELMELLF
ncbi:UPF0669 protein C6orf120 homolog [Diorhabda carinulata]|uniref:UPF0669 protein C6orf120 homolog n=1 Tax=Diorhabda carinulata TaxID=1163345 RepID=UPI0025A1E58F|nr:UPF0669 protein C6orf120 homolog [Diorhabda carinulata]